MFEFVEESAPEIKDETLGFGFEQVEQVVNLSATKEEVSLDSIKEKIRLMKIEETSFG